MWGRKRRARRKRAAFERVEQRIAGEYRRKGYSAKRARHIARATAGQAARRR
jgi:hypothetical protein